MKLLIATLLVVAFPSAAFAQNSVFGTRGLGFPGRQAGVRSVALGGAPSLFDPWSPVNPAVAVLNRDVTVGASSGTTFRQFSVLGVEQSGLQETRFPLAFVGGRVARSPLGFHISFSTFAERSFDLTTTDTVLVAGESMGITDRIVSDGGIVDVRGAMGYRASSVLVFGAAVHLFTGSSRVRATREFADTTLNRFEEQDDLSFSATGVSAGLAWYPHTLVHFALVGRTSTALDSRLGDGTSREVGMPQTVSAALSFGVTSDIRLYASTVWNSWGRLADDFATSGTRAFDTWEFNTGLELGTTRPKFPLRLGLRWAQIPFSPTDERATEWNFSVGTGTRFASDRAVIDVALVRLRRDGAGVEERGWYFTTGITITPSR